MNFLYLLLFNWVIILIFITKCNKFVIIIIIIKPSVEFNAYYKFIPPGKFNAPRFKALNVIIYVEKIARIMIS